MKPSHHRSGGFRNSNPDIVIGNFPWYETVWRGLPGDFTPLAKPAGGYDRFARGGSMPVGARMVAIADSDDAMTRDRAYRRALHLAPAVVELERGTGTFYDEKLVEPFVVAIEELRKTERAAGLSVPR